jgi:hypothetical protein
LGHRAVSREVHCSFLVKFYIPMNAKGCVTGIHLRKTRIYEGDGIQDKPI